MTHLCESFTDAILHGHDTCIRKLIANGSDPNITDGVGRSPLFWAAYFSREDFVETLVSAGANLDVKDILGRSPLHEADSSQSNDCVKKLLDAGANPNIADNEGKTPLHYVALRRHHNACIQTLIDAGANPNITDTLGKTPLHTAVRYENLICVRKLIESGANPDVIDNNGETPLQMAANGGHTKCAKMLAVRILDDRNLMDDEWDLITPGSNIGYLLPVVMTRDGRDAAAKLVSRLSEEKQKVLETATLCLSRFVSRDLVEQIAVQCV